MKLHPDRVKSVDSAARLLLKSKSRYEAVAAKTGVPWFVIAIIHMREASGSFAGVLHNGEHIIGTGRKTSLVPAGRGPFATWEAAAIDALLMHPISKTKVWDIASICYGVEAYNGWGYWWKGDHTSAYLWAGTSVDAGGKYVADHVFSATAQDAQNGAMAVLKRISELDDTVAAALGSPSAAPQSTPVAPAAPAPVSKPVNPTPPPAAPKAATKVDPYTTVGSILNAIYKAVQAVLKRKS